MNRSPWQPSERHLFLLATLIVAFLVTVLAFLVSIRSKIVPYVGAAMFTLFLLASVYLFVVLARESPARATALLAVLEGAGIYSATRG